MQVLQSGAWEIEKSKFERIVNIPQILTKCIESFESFYKNRHKTHKLMWVYGIGNMEIQYMYLKKPYQSVSTLAQYTALLALEKFENEKKTIIEISEYIGYNPLFVANELNSLVYHNSFNPKRNKAIGILLHDSEDNLDLKPENQVWLNKNFMANNLKLTTIPTVFKVITIVYFLLETTWS